jgi:hypothetical protein
MKREHHIQNLKTSIAGFKRDAEEVQSQIKSGEAAAYEKRVGHDPGYMADLAERYLESAETLQKRLEQYEKR